MERISEKYLVFIKWRLWKHCSKNEWTLAKIEGRINRKLVNKVASKILIEVKNSPNVMLDKSLKVVRRKKQKSSNLDMYPYGIAAYSSAACGI